MGLLKSQILWIHVMELVLGIVCFALFKQYGYTPCMLIEVKSQAAKCRIVFEIAAIALDAFPLIITPIFIIGNLKHGTKFDYNILNPLFALVGFVLFIVTGSVQLDIIIQIREYFPGRTALAALGVMCNVTGAAFLGELVYWLVFKLRNVDEY